MSEEEKDEMLRRYHAALNSTLALFVAYNGWDYSTVDDALDLLTENMDKYPTRASLVERIEQRKPCTS